MEEDRGIPRRAYRQTARGTHWRTQRGTQRGRKTKKDASTDVEYLDSDG